MKKLLLILAFTCALPAALTEAQRVQDFETLVAVYARQYAPFYWKQQAFQVDIFDVKPWLARVRAAQSDLEYHEIAAQWVAQLRDGHSRRGLSSGFRADLGVYVDVYDGKILIESIVRTRYPVARFPFQIGDELLTIDGRPAAEVAREFAALRSMANPSTTYRNAVDALTFRQQTSVPRMVELGDTAKVTIRRESGDVEEYELPWLKSGVRASTEIGPILTPVPFAANRAAIDPTRWLQDLRTKKAGEDESLLSTVRNEETGEPELRRRVLGWGSRFPTFAFPEGLRFQLRRGNAATDFFYSGVFQFDGQRIGYLRIPSFPGNTAVLQQMDADLAFLKANTDGLVVDLMRNTGGGCIAEDFAERLMTQPFTFGGEHLLATRSNINFAESNLRLARQFNLPQWVIDSYSFYLQALLDAAKENRALTGAVPTCGAPNNMLEPLPTAYDKPIVFLVDEFTVSFGDYFSAVMQDNGRGLFVGQRTAGWGGSVSSTAYGPFSEAVTSFTITLDARARPIASPDLPTAPFIENIGVIPDIPLEYMTRENLMTRGRPFLESVARIAADHIRGRRPTGVDR